MIGSAIVLAAAISAPALEQRDLRRIIERYPTWAVRDGKSSGAVVDVIVEADGKVRSCTVVSFVGDERLANEECSQFERFRFLPAKGPDGRPILGNYRTYVARFVRGSAQRAQVERTTQPPDIRLSAARLPDNEDVLEFDVDVLVDVGGVVELCNAGSRTQHPADTSLVEQACHEAKNSTHALLAGPDGTASYYVKNLKVRFELAGPT
jgi:hypothetical protein